MELLMMRPEEIRDAVERNVPVLMATGSVEYHGPHLPVGTDILIPRRVCEVIERRCEVVMAPHLPYSPTMEWAAPPEDGEIDFDPEPLFLYAREIFRRLVKVGFRRIYVMQHHQGEKGLAFLTVQRAASEVTREMAHTFGSAWGRRKNPPMEEKNIFSMIQIGHIDTYSDYAEGMERCPVGHGSKGETQLIMGGYPETVQMENLDVPEEMPRWLSDSHEATPEEGRFWIDFCADGWVKELGRRG